jgi:hypothetical protein
MSSARTVALRARPVRRQQVAAPVSAVEAAALGAPPAPKRRCANRNELQRTRRLRRHAHRQQPDENANGNNSTTHGSSGVQNEKRAKSEPLC